MGEELPDYILEELRCTKCECYLSVLPVYATLSQDNVCGRCIRLYENKLKELHLSMRNELYEIVAIHFVFPCRYNINGCPVKLSIVEMINHEDQCPMKN